MREQERAKRNAAVNRELRAAASASWKASAEASRALLMLGHDAAFCRLIGGHRGMLEALPASLANTTSPDRADAVLHMVVARTALRPLLVRVEVLGWLAHAHPDALATLLAFIAGEPEHRLAS